MENVNFIVRKRNRSSHSDLGRMDGCSMRINLDNCCFNRPYDQPLQTRIVNEARAKMEIQLAIAKGKLELAASFMLVAENAKCPMQMAREYNLNFMYRYAKVHVSTQRIESLKPLVLQIMNTGIKRADANTLYALSMLDADILSVWTTGCSNTGMTG